MYCMTVTIDGKRSSCHTATMPPSGACAISGANDFTAFDMTAGSPKVLPPSLDIRRYTLLLTAVESSHASATSPRPFTAMSGWSKVFYLEVLDASFSIDGVIGAFAFTMSVPLILIGNGIGAFVVREVTVRGINWISKYAYLKNGAMYSIGMLGAIMILESFGEEIPFWIAPLNTVLLLAIFLFLSWREIKLAEKLEAEGKG